MNRVISLSVLAFASVALQPWSIGQQTKAESTLPNAAPAAHGSLSSEFELLSTNYQFQNDGTGRKEVIANIRILNKMGAVQRGEQSFEYRPFSEELRIGYVRIRKKNGTLITIEKDVTHRPPDNVTPNDLDKRRVNVPGLAVGDLVEYDVVTILNRPLGSREFCLEHSFQPSGVIDERLSVDVPADREVKVGGIQAAKSWETRSGKWKTYHWRHQNPGADRILLIPYVAGRPPDVQVSSFLSWEEVGRWYEDLEKNHRVPTPELKAKADELTKGMADDLEKVESLYNFTAKKIRYISLSSLGIAGYEPHSADETLHNGYGDCKDKVALLAALLEAEGMRASSVLINPARAIDPALPSPWPFTHVIAMLHLGKEEYWMDPSSAVLPFRMLVYLIRGKQGLVAPPNGTPHFEEIPAEGPLPNTWSEEIEGKLAEDGSLDAEVKITARGDAELSIRQAFVSPIESVWPTTVQGVVGGIDRRTDKVSDVTISNPIDTDQPFTLSFQLSVRHFVDVTKASIKFRMPLANFNLPPSGEEGVMDAAGGWHRGESEPVRLGPSGVSNYQLELAFPAGYYVVSPKSVTIKSTGIEYSTNYSWDGSSLTVARRLVIDRDHLPAKFRAVYADFRRKVLVDMDRRASAERANADIDRR